MALETDLEKMSAHLVTSLDIARLSILTRENEPAFGKVVYGEPRVIQTWPLLSIQPISKGRSLKTTRKFDIQFRIMLVLYHGKVADTLSIQQGAHRRAEAVESWFLEDFKWNFVDASDDTKHKVIFGYPIAIDHPVVVAPEQELWSASRIELAAESEETF